MPDILNSANYIPPVVLLTVVLITAVPQFNCSDTYFHDREESTLAISCQLYAVNLTQYYVEYKGPGSEMGIVNSTSASNTRYSFEFRAAQVCCL